VVKVFKWSKSNLLVFAKISCDIGLLAAHCYGFIFSNVNFWRKRVLKIGHFGSYKYYMATSHGPQGTKGPDIPLMTQKSVICYMCISILRIDMVTYTSYQKSLNCSNVCTWQPQTNYNTLLEAVVDPARSSKKKKKGEGPHVKVKIVKLSSHSGCQFMSLIHVLKTFDGKRDVVGTVIYKFIACSW
jgi:hypothetical protein